MSKSLQITMKTKNATQYARIFFHILTDHCGFFDTIFIAIIITTIIITK